VKRFLTGAVVRSSIAADMAQPLKLLRAAEVVGCMLKVIGLLLAPFNLSSRLVQ
jgi:hypothetical protein